MQNKKIKFIVLLVILSVFLSLAFGIRYINRKREIAWATKLKADSRFIMMATYQYFDDHPGVTEVGFEELVRWSDENEGERSWTVTLDSEATYKCDLRKTGIRIEMTHPKVRGSVIREW